MSVKKPDNYDFDSLAKHNPELAAYLMPNKYGNISIDFADPHAVKALNRAILFSDCGLVWWDIPDGYLCPPVPGRTRYIDSLARLLAGDNKGTPPRGESVRILDIGTGANCIYPVIGHARCGWHFTGTEIDKDAIGAANLIIEKNPSLHGAVELRTQTNPASIFTGIIRKDERFDAVICNPPFHESAAEAREGTQRKWKNLGHSEKQGKYLNFGGRNTELWCRGGETAFALRMIAESIQYAHSVGWFTILISREDHLNTVHPALEKAGPEEIRVLEMEQGNKKSRALAWKFGSIKA